MLRALIAGERDPEALAELAKGKLRQKTRELQRALRGRFGDHHALLIGMSLDHIDHLEATDGPPRPRDRRGVRRPTSARRASLSTRPVTTSTRSRGREAGRRGDHRRDRCRHVKVPDRRPSRHGLASRRAPTSRAANATPARTTKGDVWLGRDPQPVRLGRRPDPRHLPQQPSSGVSPAASARRRRQSPSPTRSS